MTHIALVNRRLLPSSTVDYCIQSHISSLFPSLFTDYSLCKMAEEDPIVRFWQTTRQLLEASASNNSQSTDGFDHDTWIKRYASLAQQLEGGDSHMAGASACWKISQDVLIRLRRLSSNKPDTQEGRNLFTEHDTEALERRLLDMRQHLDIKSE